MKKKTSVKWIVKFSPFASKELYALDKQTHKHILAYLCGKLETEEDPKRFGKPLSGNLKNFWRYRINNYRVICEIKDHEFQVIAVRVAHRGKVYKNIHFLTSSSSVV